MPAETYVAPKPRERKVRQLVRLSTIAMLHKRLVPRVQRSRTAMRQKILAPKGRLLEPASLITMTRSTRALKVRRPELPQKTVTHRNIPVLREPLLELVSPIAMTRSIQAPKVQPRELPLKIATRRSTRVPKVPQRERQLIIATRHSIRAHKALRLELPLRIVTSQSIQARREQQLPPWLVPARQPPTMPS